MLVFAHGWSFDPSFWSPIRARLRLPGIDLDPDYRLLATPSLPEGRFVGVGHSLGGLYLLRQCGDRLDGLVLINGFARFTSAPDWPHGTKPRVLARMRQAFADRPDQVVADFRARIGAPPSPATPDLAFGLGALATWDERPTLAARRFPVLCLAGRSDPLVAESATLATSDVACAACHWHDGGHLLPWSAPDWCAAAIVAFASA
jgi:pimeloyl-[acyl-carrier protein] methyl ester esterase